MMTGDGWNWFRIFRTADFDIRSVESSGSVCIVLVYSMRFMWNNIPLSKWSWG
jgi:hypothetical protein